MQKELLEIEFRYHDRPIGSCPATSCSKTIAIGIFDTLEEAVKAGNETLKVLSEHFQVRADDRFKVRGLFGLPDRLVTNCCYTTKGVAYFARITPLKFDDLSETIAETFKAYDRYRQYRRIKLTPDQKEYIKWLREKQLISYSKLAKIFGVSKRLIQFICCPDKYLKNKESLKQRKAEGRYKPTKAEWAATIREHRRYKEQLKKKGDIK